MSRSRILTRSKPIKSLTFDQDGNDSDDEEEENPTVHNTRGHAASKLIVTSSRPSRAAPGVHIGDGVRKAPPNKRFRKLRLCDTPHTPKTLMKKSSIVEASRSPPLLPTVTSSLVEKSSTNTMTIEKPPLAPLHHQPSHQPPPPTPITTTTTTIISDKVSLLGVSQMTMSSMSSSCKEVSPLPLRNPMLRDQLMRSAIRSPKSQQQSRRKFQQFLHPPVVHSLNYETKEDFEMTETNNNNNTVCQYV